MVQLIPQIQKIVRDYHEQLYINKFDNLEEMLKFLETYNLPRLNHEETGNLNRPITRLEQASKTFQHRKVKKRWFHWWINTIFLKLFQRSEEEVRLSNSFSEASITLIPKPDRDTVRKGNYRQISLMNINAKILNKVLTNWIQWHIKSSRYQDHNRVRFISGIQGWFSVYKSINMIHHINRMKDKNHMIISINAEKYI